MWKPKRLLIGLLVVAGLWLALEAATNYRWFIPPPPADVRVEVTGAAGSAVDIAYEADGVAFNTKATVPAAFGVRARRFSYTIRRGGQSGDLFATLYVDGVSHGTTGGPCAWVKGTTEGRRVVLAACGPEGDRR